MKYLSHNPNGSLDNVRVRISPEVELQSHILFAGKFVVGPQTTMNR